MRIFLSFVFLSILLGCAKNDSKDAAPFPLIEEYYPGKIGSYIDYQVDSIFHNDALALHDTITYKIRELLESNFIDDEGRKSIRIERYISTADSTNWILKDIWYSTTTNVRLEKIEEDVRFTKLVNPIEKNETWNGNAQNTLEEWEYNYNEIEKPFALEILNFDKTVTVLQRDNQANGVNYIQDQYAKEVYAEGVGMVYKYYKMLETKFGYQDSVVAVNINSGVEYTMKAINYGQL